MNEYLKWKRWEGRMNTTQLLKVLTASVHMGSHSYVMMILSLSLPQNQIKSCFLSSLFFFFLSFVYSTEISDLERRDVVDLIKNCMKLYPDHIIDTVHHYSCCRLFNNFWDFTKFYTTVYSWIYILYLYGWMFFCQLFGFHFLETLKYNRLIVIPGDYIRLITNIGILC